MQTRHLISLGSVLRAWKMVRGIDVTDRGFLAVMTAKEWPHARR